MVATLPLSSSTAGTDGSASSIAAGAASGYHLLKIEGYSDIKSTIPNGKHVESHPFRAAGRTWSIQYYPNGVCPDTADYISIYLLLKETVASHLMVRVVFSFVDEEEKQTPSYIRTAEPSKYDVSHDTWGRTEFVKRSELEQSERLKDDCFTVRCDIVVISEPRVEAIKVPASSFVMVPPPDSSQHFGALLLGGKGADVRFLVAGETFDAPVLAARSPVFDALLFGPMKEGTATESSIRIDDMLPQVFQSMLHFIYTDSLQETEGQDKEVIATMMQHLLEAADRYGMERLKLICEDSLCRYLDVSTVATSLALAEQHRCQGLKKACFEFLKSLKTLDEVMATDGFQHLAKSSPSALFELMSKLAER